MLSKSAETPQKPTLTSENGTEETKSTVLEFDFPKRTEIPSVSDPRIIKVIGVGGGGGNAVAHMYNEGMNEVRFEVCNTDKVSLQDNPVPIQRLIGKEGLGTGGDPEKGRTIAEDSLDEINKMFTDGTRMVFITAGMGGGTGTGVSPIIAREAKKAGILTVGVVTIPFLCERNQKIDLALDGVEELSHYVDSLLIVNNERLREICAFNTMKKAFERADDTLLTAVKSIADIITTHGKINPDFNDVKAVLSNGGVALISTGEAEGTDRLKKALQEAVTSPLLNDNDIVNSNKILLCIYCSQNEEETLTMAEWDDVTNFMNKFKNEDIGTKFGVIYLPDMGKKVRVSILASGFGFAKAENEIDIDAKRAKDERRKKIYGDKGVGKIARKRRHNVFHFTEDTIDNSEIIEMITSYATYERRSDTLKKINELYSDTSRESDRNIVPSSDETRTIKFRQQ